MILDTLINPKLAETCILSAYPEGSVVLDPFIGSGTTGLCGKTAKQALHRH